MKTNNKLKMSIEEFSTLSLNDVAKLLGHNVTHGTKTPHEHFEDFMSRMDGDSDNGIVKRFNSQVGIKGWTGATGAYMSAIRKQFEKRGIDYSEVGTSSVMSYREKVTMIKNKLIINTDK